MPVRFIYRLAFSTPLHSVGACSPGPSLVDTLPSLYLTFSRLLPNQELHLSPITGKKIHLPQAASTALTHKPKPEPEAKHKSDRNPTHSKPASPPYTRSAPPAQIINHFRDFTNLHQQLWPLVQAIAPIFPLSQTLGPRAYHASRKHGCHRFSPKHRQRRHRSLQQDPPVSFFLRGERRTLHPECLRPRKVD